MWPIVTDAERPPCHSAPRTARLLRRVSIPGLTVVAVWSSTVGFGVSAAGGDTVAGAKAKAAAIEAQLATAQAEMSTLSQQYDAAAYKLGQINANIASTKATITSDRQTVSDDRSALGKAAVSNYITDGSAASANSLFGGNSTTVGATTEYTNIASGDINEAVANLHTAENALNAKEAQLTSEQSQAQSQIDAENAAIAQNKTAIASQQSALNQENGEVGALVAQQQQQEVAQAAQATQAKLAAASTPSNSSTVASLSTAFSPPTAPGGAGAVQAAESQLGVPYVWGGETPGVGFDCSGLTAWAWGQVGVSLAHYSGAQMGESASVPVSDLQPGDLLFYGPGGSEHVAMYVGGGTMIEAPDTGGHVQLTPLRLGDGFVGAGRP
jgi:cell wall-associated NlpC family hydrolase